LVEAERLYRDILTAVDAGSLPTADLGHSLGPLTQIYRTWGRNDDALRMAQRYRNFLIDSTKLDAQVRQQQLDDNALQLSISSRALVATTRRSAISRKRFEPVNRASGDPTRRLLLLVKSAQLAEAAGDSAKSRDRWSQVVAKERPPSPGWISVSWPSSLPRLRRGAGSRLRRARNFPAAIEIKGGCSPCKSPKRMLPLK